MALQISVFEADGKGSAITAAEQRDNSGKKQLLARRQYRSRFVAGAGRPQNGAITGAQRRQALIILPVCASYIKIIWICQDENGCEYGKRMSEAHLRFCARP
jgi:hypothetical protein